MAACVRCGNFVCTECDVIAGGQHHCWPCLRQVGRVPPVGGRRFIRARHGRMLAGVCGGLARYFRMDVTLIRVVVVLVAFFTALLPVAVA